MSSEGDSSKQGCDSNKELRKSDEPIISSPDGQTSEAYINRGEFLQIHRQKLEYQMEFF